MGSEAIIDQVIEEIRQSILLINESLGSDKYETSSFPNFSLSAILDICDIKIVDELPPITPINDNFFVIPFEEALNNQVTSQTQNNLSNFIILTPPSSIGHSSESENWNYNDDCESTSEGSFLTNNDIEERNNEFESDFELINQNIKSNVNNNLEGDEFVQVNKQNYINLFSCNHINASKEKDFQDELSHICNCDFDSQSSEPGNKRSRNISLFCDSCLKNQNESKSIPLNSPNILRREVNTEVDDAEKDYKLIKCDSHVSICRKNALY